MLVRDKVRKKQMYMMTTNLYKRVFNFDFCDHTPTKNTINIIAINGRIIIIKKIILLNCLTQFHYELILLTPTVVILLLY